MPATPQHSPLTVMTVVTNAVTASVAAGLLLNRVRNPELEPRPWRGGEPEAPYVEIIIPARNEERNIEQLLETLLVQDYPPERFGITVVDDGSTDATGDIVERIAKWNPLVRLVRAGALPSGWTGKNNAMAVGAAGAPAGTDYLLFVDADTRHHPLTLATVVQHAQRTGSDMISLIIDVDMRTFWERVLVPQVGELYTLLVGTMDSVNRKGGSAAANGQFMLMTPDLYNAVGALDSVRGDVAEDRALAAAAKARGYSLRLEYGRRLIRARVYSSFGDMWSGYSKTLFWATGHNTVRTLLVVAELTAYALFPVVALAVAILRRERRRKRRALVHSALQLGPMLFVRTHVCRLMGLPAAYAVTYPLGVAVGNVLLVYSVYRVKSGRGVAWKGRLYGADSSRT